MSSENTRKTSPPPPDVPTTEMHEAPTVITEGGDLRALIARLEERKPPRPSPRQGMTPTPIAAPVSAPALPVAGEAAAAPTSQASAAPRSLPSPLAARAPLAAPAPLAARAPLAAPASMRTVPQPPAQLAPPKRRAQVVGLLVVLALIIASASLLWLWRTL